jgi:hypothetical protein
VTVQAQTTQEFLDDYNAKQRAEWRKQQTIDLEKEMAIFKSEMTKGMRPENPVRQIMESMYIDGGRVTYNGKGIPPLPTRRKIIINKEQIEKPVQSKQAAEQAEIDLRNAQREFE